MAQWINGIPAASRGPSTGNVTCERIAAACEWSHRCVPAEGPDSEWMLTQRALSVPSADSFCRGFQCATSILMSRQEIRDVPVSSGLRKIERGTGTISRQAHLTKPIRFLIWCRCILRTGSLVWNHNRRRRADQVSYGPWRKPNLLIVS